MKAPKTLSYDFDTMPSCEYQDITEFYKGDKHEYIRRDVVITAINEGLSIVDYDTEGRAESILNKAIDNADDD